MGGGQVLPLQRKGWGGGGGTLCGSLLIHLRGGGDSFSHAEGRAGGGGKTF